MKNRIMHIIWVLLLVTALLITAGAFAEEEPGNEGENANWRVNEHFAEITFYDGNMPSPEDRFWFMNLQAEFRQSEDDPWEPLNFAELIEEDRIELQCDIPELNSPWRPGTVTMRDWRFT